MSENKYGFYTKGAIVVLDNQIELIFKKENNIAMKL
jgi:hypothetical protein